MKLRDVLTVVLGVLLLASCDGIPPTGVIPPPQQAETVTVTSVTLAIEGSVVKLSATATSTRIGSLQGDSRYSWIVNGSSSYTGQSIALSAPPGNISYCVTAPGADSVGRRCETGSVPGFTGRVREFDFARDDIPARGVFIRFWKGADTTTANVASNGTFSVVSKLATQDSVNCMIDAMDPSNRIYHPIKCMVERPGGSIVKTVYPFTLTLPASYGIYGGVELPFSISRAYPAVGMEDTDPSFYPISQRIRLPDGRVVYFYQMPSYRNLPVPIAFRDSIGDTPVSEAEKAQVWEIINSLSQYLGRTHFRPAVGGEVTDTTGVSIFVRPLPYPQVSEMSAGYANWQQNDLGGCRLVFTNTDWVFALIRQQLVHCLGFSRGYNWAGITNIRDGATTVPSALDALYILVMYRTREIERGDGGVRCTLMESHEGEREFMFGLPSRNAICYP